MKPCQSVTVLAPAKLNLALDVVGLLPSGYHDLDMTMQAITLYERVNLHRSQNLTLQMPGSRVAVCLHNCPEYLLQYVPKDAVYYMGLCDEWDEEKYKILRSLGLKVEILWRKTPEERGVTASWVRGCIAADQEWAHLVPKSVYAYLTENHLDERIKRLEQMRLDEKDASLVWSEKKEE